MTLISVLLPSRGRPDWLARMTGTALETAANPALIEIVCRLDDDDPTGSEYRAEWIDPQVRFLHGPRQLLSECWNHCAAHATGEILMHCGDDITFDTPGWDTHVRQAFAEVPDRILFAHGDDLGPNGTVFGTHGFIHRRWMETVGYFVPPLFSSDWNDVWLNEVAEAIGRKRLLPIVTEHHHYTFGKAPRDQTHADREQRGQDDDVVNLYKKTLKDRERDAEKLRAVMA